MLARSSLALSLALAAAPAFAGGFAPAVAPAAPAVPVAVAPVAPASDWTGFYAGGQLGFGDLTMDIHSTIGEGSAGFGEGSGALLGAHAGYMRDFGRLVVGGEVDFDVASLDLEGVEYAAEVPNLGSLDSIARAKLRLGFDAGRFLPYVTAGVARASLSFEGEADGFAEDSMTGRFIGLGAAYAVNDRLTIGVEALRHSFDGPEVTSDDFVELDTDLTTVSVRASWRF